MGASFARDGPDEPAADGMVELFGGVVAGRGGERGEPGFIVAGDYLFISGRGLS